MIYIFQRLLASLSLLSFAVTPLSAKDGPLTLQPSSQWVLNAGAENCRLLRSFGEGDQKVYVIFDRFGPSNAFRLTVAGKPIKPLIDKRKDGDKTRIQFGPDEVLNEVYPSEGTFGDDPALIFSSNTTVGKIEKDSNNYITDPASFKPTAPISVDQLAAIGWLEIGDPKGAKLRLETGALAKPFDILSLCTDQLLTLWGYDPAKAKALKRQPSPQSTPNTWLNGENYPPNKLYQRKLILVEFRLDVDATGKATGCHIQESTASKFFDEALCQSALKRAVFTPALDADGKPVASHWNSEVRHSLSIQRVPAR